MGKKKNLMVTVAAGAVIFAVFVFGIGVGNLIRMLSASDPLFLLAAVAFNMFNLFAFTATWRALVPVKVSFYKLFKLYMAGVFVNNLTPAFGAGGEPVKAVFLAKETRSSKSECFASVVAQRMINMFPFVLIAVFGLVTLLTNKNLKPIEVAVLIGSLILSISMFCLILYLYKRKDMMFAFARASAKIITFFFRLFRKGIDPGTYSRKIEESVTEFHNGLAGISSRRDSLFVAVSFSFLGWAFDVLAAYSVFIAIDYHISLSLLIVVYTIAMIAGMLPLLPGGLGVVDGAMALLYISSGVPAGVAMLSTLTYRMIAYWLNTIIGAVYLRDIGVGG